MTARGLLDRKRWATTEHRLSGGVDRGAQARWNVMLAGPRAPSGPVGGHPLLIVSSDLDAPTRPQSCWASGPDRRWLSTSDCGQRTSATGPMRSIRHCDASCHCWRWKVTVLHRFTPDLMDKRDYPTSRCLESFAEQCDSGAEGAETKRHCDIMTCGERQLRVGRPPSGAYQHQPHGHRCQRRETGSPP